MPLFRRLRGLKQRALGVIRNLSNGLQLELAICEAIEPPASICWAIYDDLERPFLLTTSHTPKDRRLLVLCSTILSEVQFLSDSYYAAGSMLSRLIYNVLWPTRITCEILNVGSPSRGLRKFWNVIARIVNPPADPYNMGALRMAKIKVVLPMLMTVEAGRGYSWKLAAPTLAAVLAWSFASNLPPSKNAWIAVHKGLANVLALSMTPTWEL